MHQNGYSNNTLQKLMPERSPKNSEVKDKLEVGYMSSRHITGLKQPLFQLRVPQLLSDQQLSH